MSKAKQIVDKLLLGLSSILLIAMVVLSLWQVSARYIFSISSPGTEELIRYMLIWFGLMSAAYVFGAKKHIAILFFREKFSLKIQHIIQRVIDILIMGVAAVLMLYGGMKVVLLTSSQTTAALGLPMAFVYSSLPVSSIFIIFYTVHRMITDKMPMKEEVEL